MKCELSARFYCFTLPTTNTLFKFCSLNDSFEQIDHDNFTFIRQRCIQIGNDLYAFSFEPLTVYKYAAITKTTSTLAGPDPIILASLNDSRVSCALAADIDDRIIYLTGGTVVNAKSKTALSFNLAKSLFTEIPSMNEPRAAHSSTVAGGKLYVFGGNRPHARSSIEVFDRVKWEILSFMETRYMSSVCTISDSTILIIGGANERLEYAPDVLFFDIQTGRTEKIAEASYGLRCFSQTHTEKDGNVMIMVNKKYEELCILRFNIIAQDFEELASC